MNYVPKNGSAKFSLPLTCYPEEVSHSTHYVDLSLLPSFCSICKFSGQLSVHYYCVLCLTEVIGEIDMLFGSWKKVYSLGKSKKESKKETMLVLSMYYI